MERKPPQRLRAFFRSAFELSAVLTLVAGVIVLVRVVTVSRGNLEIAYLLLASSNFIAVLLSTILLLAPGIVAILLAATLMMFWVRSMRFSNADDHVGSKIVSLAYAGAACSVALLAVIVFTPFPKIWLTIAIAGVVAGLLVAASFGLKHFFRNRVSVWKFSTRIGVLVTMTSVIIFSPILALSVVDLDTAWAPREVVLYDNDEVGVGRIVGSSDGFLVVLRDDPRDVFLVRADSVKARWTCTSERVDELESRLLTGWRWSRVASIVRECDEILKEHPSTLVP